MSQQTMPFFESSEAATRHAIEASGRELKQVACSLWPSKTPEAARTALANALNPNRDERLTADQHVFIANLTSNYAWLYYVCHQCSHTKPDWQTPEEQSAKAQREFTVLADQMKQLLAQFETIKPKLRAA